MVEKKTKKIDIRLKTIGMTRDRFKKLFGKYVCKKCKKEFTPPVDREVHCGPKGMREYCECGGLFVKTKKNDYAHRFRAYLTEDEILLGFYPKKSSNEIRMLVKEKKKIEENVLLIKDINEFSDYVTEEYTKRLPQLIDKRNKQLSTLSAKFLEKHKDLLTSTTLKNENKVDGYALTQALSKTFVPIGVNANKYSSDDIMLSFNFYWEKIEELIELNPRVKIVPTIYQFCSMIGIPTSNFTKYKLNGDDRMRNVCEIIQEKFIDFYTTRGMTNELNTIMSIFILKSVHGLTEAVEEQRVVHQFTIGNQEMVSGIEKRLGINGKTLVEIGNDEL